ncbi:MAG: hypothetical protein CMH26_00675 [Micavibrio sp.]|nr:hypothetical protein [Micavibrio sp.]|tara:strand:+ start:3089 stop:3289 length:201 start_codon:yes stop_codon:yes gene_type:complete
MVEFLNKGFNGNAKLVQGVVKAVVSDGLSADSETGYSAQFSGSTFESDSADSGASAPSVNAPSREL